MPSFRYAHALGRLRIPVTLLLVAFVQWSSAGSVNGQQILRQGFESDRVLWEKSGFDAQFDEKKHEISTATSHGGNKSEHISLEVKPGNFIYYTFPLGNAPLGEEFSGSVWVKANRPGIQLMARVVLPREADPSTPGGKITTFLRGDKLNRAGEWRRLDLGKPMFLLKQQQALLQAQLKRSVDVTEAYVDALMLNVYGGPGPTDVWIDDVEAGPVIPESKFKTVPRVAGETVPTPGVSIAGPARRGSSLEFTGTQFRDPKSKKGTIFRFVQWQDTPIDIWKQAGFNAVSFHPRVSANELKLASEQGLYVIPHLSVVSEDLKPIPPEQVAASLARYSGSEIPFILMGNTLSTELAPQVAKLASQVRSLEPGRPIGADVWDGIDLYSRQLNMTGVHRWPLMTTLELSRYREWLEQRRRLATPGAFFWTWVQTHVPEEMAQILYDRSTAGTFQEPIGPQPEQIRLLTYTALASGFRGLGYWSDRFFADSHTGRDRLLTCAMMNQEIDMIESMLVTSDDYAQWVPTSSGDVQAAVMRTDKGVLVLPVWLGKYAQVVPGQAAVGNLSIVVPQVPPSARAWEVTPSEVRSLKTERVVGGTKVFLPEFGMTSAIVFTSDHELVGTFQMQARQKRQLFADWSRQLAVYETEKVLKIQKQLAEIGQSIPEYAGLMQEAQNRLTTAKVHYENRNFAEAANESERALRPVRIMMRAQWERAVRGAESVALDPYTTSYFTLPKHWQMKDEIDRSRVGQNVLPGGDFELAQNRAESAWRLDEPNLDNVEMTAQRVGNDSVPAPKPQPEPDPNTPTRTVATVVRPNQGGLQCAMLQMKPRPGKYTPLGLERSMQTLTSPTVKLPPGTLVQISGWIRIPEYLVASPDGALIFDSAAGEAFAVRMSAPTPWKKVTFYRRVPASGEIRVVLALTGIGTVYFDDVMVEPLIPQAGVTTRTASNAAPR